MKEIRTHQLGELRTDADGRRLRGHAVIWGTLSQDLGGFLERIDRHAFDETLQADARSGDVVALREHRPELLLGRRSSGTLTLFADDHGLAFDVQLPTTELGKDTAQAVARGDLNATSFAFVVQDDTLERENKAFIRTVTRATLLDISAVVFPAYSQTQGTLTVRGLQSIGNVELTRGVSGLRRIWQLRHERTRAKLAAWRRECEEQQW